MTLRWPYLIRVLAGAIFGLYMAHLLYFLNPQVDITPTRLATVTIIYGVICGFLFGSILWLLRLGRVRLFGESDPKLRTHGFGFVVFAAFVASSIYWIHLIFLRIYLPIGAVRILSKATNAITVTAFVLLLLWALERNATKRVSRVILLIGVALIAISSVFLYQRRESYRTDRREVVVANIGTVAGQRRVIVVAIRNLPYDWILTMSGEGILPFFEKTTRRAWFSRLEPFSTTSPKALWASLATGKLPYRHGVTGRFSYRTPLNSADPAERFLLIPSGVGFRAWGLIPPVTRISAQLPAGDALPLWSLFERLDFRAGVCNWPAALPRAATEVITDRVVRDPRAQVPLQVTAAAQRFGVAGETRTRTLLGLGADWRAVLACTRNRENFQLQVVALEGFSEAQRAQHIFTNELPPRSSAKGEVLRAYAQQLDRMLSEIAAGHPGDLLLVVSPSAVVPPQLPANAWALLQNALRSDDPGADDGFLLIDGPGVAHQENPPTAYVVDVVPTVLFAAGLPVGRDMDGRVLSDAFTDDFLRTNHLAAIQTYEAGEMVVRRNQVVN